MQNRICNLIYYVKILSLPEGNSFLYQHEKVFALISHFSLLTSHTARRTSRTVSHRLYLENGIDFTIILNRKCLISMNLCKRQLTIDVVLRIMRNGCLNLKIFFCFTNSGTFYSFAKLLLLWCFGYGISGRRISDRLRHSSH